MSGHDLWHIVVLGSTLFAGAGIAIIVITSLLLEDTPPEVTRARPAVAALSALAVGLLALEWLGVH